MSFAPPGVNQHVVEFITGTGVRLDGIVIDSSSGPWNWTVPDGVALLFITGVGGGGGGAGGTNNATTSGGGGGGGSGAGVYNLPLPVRPKTALTIALGAGGTGGTQTVAATDGGSTTISGLHLNFYGGGTVFTLPGGGGSSSVATDANGKVGGVGGIYNGGYGLVGPGAQAIASGTPGQGASTLESVFGFLSQTGSGGGAANTTPGSNGANGGSRGTRATPGTWYQTPANAAGNTTGSLSRGGGGLGGCSILGAGGAGGAGGANGTSAASTDYGAGGGGGGGGPTTGGNGAGGYLAIIYWSAE